MYIIFDTKWHTIIHVYVRGVGKNLTPELNRVPDTWFNYLPRQIFLDQFYS